MDRIVIDKHNVVEYIFDTLYSSKIKPEKINNGKFHHNTSYENAPLVCEYGILSLLELNRVGIRKDSKRVLEIMNDTESHINGNDGISLSVLGLKDIYNNEDVYNPFNSSNVDFIVSNNIKAHRNSFNYGNEYICYNRINIKDILSLDFRILEYINLRNKSKIKYDKLVAMYNALLKSSLKIKKLELNLLLREMSFNNPMGIDIDKFSKSKQLILEQKRIV